MEMWQEGGKKALVVAAIYAHIPGCLKKLSLTISSSSAQDRVGDPDGMILDDVNCLSFFFETRAGGGDAA